jgi:hypothetical protein
MISYKYDPETFWAGNEFLFFENKDIRSAANNIAKLTQTRQFMGLTCILMPREPTFLIPYPRCKW